jgi:NADH dehydrogenase
VVYHSHTSYSDGKVVGLGVPPTSLKRIVIIGGGFAGIKLIKKLSTQKFQIVLLDKNNYHQFQPLLYQVALGGLEPSSIAFPLRRIPKNKLIHFRMTEVKKIWSAGSYIETSKGDLKYDYLIIATGSKPNFYGNKSIEARALRLKSIPDALDIRNWLFQNLEEATLTNNMKPSTIVIVGGGPTGVEIAGALADIRNHVLPKDYPELKFKDAKIYLIEGEDKLLGAMSETTSKYAKKYLEEMEVKIIFNQRVNGFNGNAVFLGDGETIEASILIWTAGVIGNPVPGLNENTLLKSRRYKVDIYNRVRDYENIFALGDAAAMQNPIGDSHPMLAPVAIQQAKNLANNLNQDNPGDWKPFHYFDKGVLATIGRNKALADFGSINLHGFFAWLIWVFAHLMSLVGFRNRVVVFTNWVLNYFSFGSAIRLIIRPVRKKTKKKEEELHSH